MKLENLKTKMKLGANATLNDSKGNTISIGETVRVVAINSKGVKLKSEDDDAVGETDYFFKKTDWNEDAFYEIKPPEMIGLEHLNDMNDMLGSDRQSV